MHMRTHTNTHKHTQTDRHPRDVTPCQPSRGSESGTARSPFVSVSLSVCLPARLAAGYHPSTFARLLSHSRTQTHTHTRMQTHLTLTCM